MNTRAAIFAVCLAGCDPASEATHSATAVVNGAPTTEFDAVVAIGAKRSGCGDPLTVLCSGTLITPDAVLSAAHCFDDMRPGLAFEVFVGDALAEGGLYIDVVRVQVDPLFDADGRGHDLSVLRLAQPVSRVTPATLPDDSAVELGAIVDMVGFGTTQANVAPDGIKRVGAGEVALLNAVIASVAPAPAITCQGDSGGPLFLEDDTSAAPTVWAVASSGDPGCMQTSIFSRVWPGLQDFVMPALAEPVPERPLQATCGSECTTDAACPVGWVCVVQDDGAQRCALPGRLAGSLESTCVSDVDCGTACVAASEGCQCYEACDVASGGSSGCGCSVWDRRGALGGDLGALALIVFAALLVARRTTANP